MPVKPLRPCNKLGCNKLTNNSYCDEHLKQVKTERNKYYDKHKRNKQSDSFYHSREWDVVRRASLSRDKGLCVHCLQDKRITQADVVDHIIPIQVNWDLRLTLSNTQCLCHNCHAKKTAEDEEKFKG